MTARSAWAILTLALLCLVPLWGCSATRDILNSLDKPTARVVDARVDPGPLRGAAVRRARRGARDLVPRRRHDGTASQMPAHATSAARGRGRACAG